MVIHNIRIAIHTCIQVMHVHVGLQIAVGLRALEPRAAQPVMALLLLGSIFKREDYKITWK